MRFAVEEWTRWRKKLVVAKQARAFSPSRSLIAWIVLTMPPLQFPPLSPRCITLGIYSSICRHLAKYRLGGWSFLGTTGPTSTVEWSLTRDDRWDRVREGKRSEHRMGEARGLQLIYLSGHETMGPSIEPASSDRPWRAAQETRPSHPPLRLARAYLRIGCAEFSSSFCTCPTPPTRTVRERFQPADDDWLKKAVCVTSS